MLYVVYPFKDQRILVVIVFRICLHAHRYYNIDVIGNFVFYFAFFFSRFYSTSKRAKIKRNSTKLQNIYALRSYALCVFVHATAIHLSLGVFFLSFSATSLRGFRECSPKKPEWKKKKPEFNKHKRVGTRSPLSGNRWVTWVFRRGQVFHFHPQRIRFETGPSVVHTRARVNFIYITYARTYTLIDVRITDLQSAEQTVRNETRSRQISVLKSTTRHDFRGYRQFFFFQFVCRYFRTALNASRISVYVKKKKINK